MKNSYSQIVRDLVKDLPKNDYPVLNTRLWVETWFHFIINQHLRSMRDLMSYLKATGTQFHLSTFSRANQNRNAEVFSDMYKKIAQKVRKKFDKKFQPILALDSTTITLTSKLFHQNNYREAKLLCSQNSETKIPEDISIELEKIHDHRMFMSSEKELESAGIVVMDRGFASQEIIKRFSQKKQLFVIRIKSNYTLLMLSDGWCLLGKKNPVKCRVVMFGDIATKKEYYLATNLPENTSPNVGFSNEDVGEIYRKRWAIELLWKFLKMHLKLDKLITKNYQGVVIQIWACLIVYLILLLVEIPEIFGEKLLDKLRYLQVIIHETLPNISIKSCRGFG